MCNNKVDAVSAAERSVHSRKQPIGVCIVLCYFFPRGPAVRQRYVVYGRLCICRGIAKFNCNITGQGVQLSQRNRATFRVIKYFAESLKVIAMTPLSRACVFAVHCVFIICFTVCEAFNVE